MDLPRVVALLNVPFQALGPCPLGPFRRRALLRAAGLSAYVRDLNLAFARAIGRGAHRELVEERELAKFAEWMFSRHAWGRPGGDDDVFLARFAADLERLRFVGDPRRWLLRLRDEVVPEFLAGVCERVAADGPPGAVVLSCGELGLNAALALGHRLKRRLARLRLVLAGPGVRGHAGAELFRAAPWLDGVALDDDDHRLVALLRALYGQGAPQGLTGALARRGGQVFGALAPGARDDLLRADDPPPAQPDVAPDLDALRAGPQGHVHVLMSSRTVTHGDLSVHELAPRCRAASGSGFTAFERRPAAPRDLALALVAASPLARPTAPAAGDRRRLDPQPDIDSLSTRLLGLLDREQTGLDNAFRLKDLTGRRARLDWDLLCGIPGERLADYDQQDAWFERIVHLRPPRRLRLLEYQQFPEARRGGAIDRLTPAAWYADVFPAERIELARIAGQFDVVWRDVLSPAAYLGVRRRVARWQQRWRGDVDPPALVQRPVAGGGLELEDTRGPRPVLWRLGPIVAALYRAIAAPATISALACRCELSGLAGDRLHELSRSLCAAGLALGEGDRLLGLALPARPGDPPFAGAVAERRTIADPASAR